MSCWFQHTHSPQDNTVAATATQDKGIPYSYLFQMFNLGERENEN